MGIFDSISNVLFGEAENDTPSAQYGSVESQFGDIFNLLFQYPEMFKGLQMAGSLGQDPVKWLGQFVKDGKDSATGAGVKLPNGKFLDIGALTQANAGLASQYEDKTLQWQGDFYKKMSQVPGMEGVFSDAAGNFGAQFTKDINTGYEQMAGAALGTGAKTGFLADPLVQAKILGPLAMQKAAYLKDIQLGAQGKALALTGAGNALGGSQMATMGLGVSPYAQAAAGGASLFGLQNSSLGSQGSFLNSQLQSQNSMFNTNMAYGFGMNAFKATGGALWGGAGGNPFFGGT